MLKVVSPLLLIIAFSVSAFADQKFECSFDESSQRYLPPSAGEIEAQLRVVCEKASQHGLFDFYGALPSLKFPIGEVNYSLGECASSWRTSKVFASVKNISCTLGRIPH